MLEKLTLVDAEPRPETWPEIHEERQANRFAAALLMPDCAVKDMVSAELSPAQMARRFGVSVEAMAAAEEGAGIEWVEGTPGAGLPWWRGMVAGKVRWRISEELLRD